MVFFIFIFELHNYIKQKATKQFRISLNTLCYWTLQLYQFPRVHFTYCVPVSWVSLSLLPPISWTIVRKWVSDQSLWPTASISTSDGTQRPGSGKDVNISTDRDCEKKHVAFGFRARRCGTIVFKRKFVRSYSSNTGAEIFMCFLVEKRTDAQPLGWNC